MFVYQYSFFLSTIPQASIDAFVAWVDRNILAVKSGSAVTNPLGPTKVLPGLLHVIVLLSSLMQRQTALTVASLEA